MTDTSAWEIEQAAEIVRQMADASLAFFQEGLVEAASELAGKAASLCDHIPEESAGSARGIVSIHEMRDMGMAIHHLSQAAVFVSRAGEKEARKRIQSKSRALAQRMPDTWTKGMDSDGTCIICGQAAPPKTRDAREALAELKVTQEIEERLREELKGLDGAAES